MRKLAPSTASTAPVLALADIPSAADIRIEQHPPVDPAVRAAIAAAAIAAMRSRSSGAG